MSNLIVVKGEKMTMRQADKQFGLDRNRVHRLAAAHGISIQDVYNHPELWDKYVRTAWEEPPYTILGIEYTTLQDLAEACYTDIDTLRTKLDRSYAGRVTYGMTELQKQTYFTFRYNNVMYASVPFIIGLPYTRITDLVPASSLAAAKKQFAQGKSVEEALQYLKQFDRTKIVDGVKYRSQEEFLKTLGVSAATFAERVEKLGSEAAAIQFYRDKRAAEKDLPIYIVNNVKCRTAPEVYYALGLTIRMTSFSEYVRAHGLEDAIAHYSSKGSQGQWASIERYTVGDRQGLGIKEAAELAHTAATTLRKRAKETGKSVQTLLNESYDEYMRDPPPYVFEGKSHRNITELANTLGVYAQRISKLQDKGYTVLEAAAEIRSYQADRSTYYELRGKADALGISKHLYEVMLEKLGTHESVKAYVEKYPKVFAQERPFQWEQAPQWECVIDGERYYIMRDIAEALGQSVSAVNSYYFTHPGITMQEVVEYYQASTPRRALWQGDIMVAGINCTCYADVASILAVPVPPLKNSVSKLGLQAAIDSYLAREECKEAVRVTVHSKGLRQFLRVEKGIYLATCCACNRTMLLTAEECQTFLHSDSFCKSAQWESAE